MHLAMHSLLFSGLFFLVSLPTGWIAGALMRKLRVLSERKHWSHNSTIYAEYESPGGLCPGEVAYLYDRVFGEPELLATLFDLELRNKVELSTVPSEVEGVNFNIRVIGKAMDPSLLDFEQELLTTIDSYGPTANWELLKTDTAIWDSGIEDHLKVSLQEKGYLQQDGAGMNALFKYSLIGAGIAGLTVLLPILLKQDFGNQALASTNPYAGLNRDFNVLVGIILFVIASAIYGVSTFYAGSAYYRALDIEKGTKQLKAIWPHLAGFRDYIAVVELDEIKFENDTLRNNARQHSLPYAIALNLSTRWQDRFKG